MINNFFRGKLAIFFPIVRNWKNVMLRSNRVVGRDTSENIMMWFEEIISEFDIAEKLKHVNTNSGANVKKAFVTLPGNCSAYDQNILRDLMEILTPFEEVTDFVQVDCVPSAGYVLPPVKRLAHHMKMPHQNIILHSSFVSALKSSLER